MELKRLVDDERWNRFVDTSPQGNLFQYTWYVNGLGLPYEIWIAERGETILAGCLMCRYGGKWAFGPFQKYMGLLYNKFEGNLYSRTSNERRAADLLLEKIDTLNGYDYFFHPSFRDWLPFYRHGYKADTYYTYRINLYGKTQEDLLNLCAPRLRTKIRKAASDTSLTIKENTEPAAFYDVYKNTFSRQGQHVPLTLPRFAALCNALQDNNGLTLYSLQDKNNQTTAVLGIAYDLQAAYLLFSGFSDRWREDGHNEWLIFKAICKAAEKVKVFDFEGSMLPGVESFYRQFGGEQTPYFRIYRPSVMNQIKESIRKWL